MTFDEMEDALSKIGDLLNSLAQSQLSEEDSHRYRRTIVEVKTALREYSGLHHMMAPRVLRRGYIEAKQ